MKENIREYVSEKTVRLLRGAGFYGYDSYKDVPVLGFRNLKGLGYYNTIAVLEYLKARYGSEEESGERVDYGDELTNIDEAFFRSGFTSDAKVSRMTVGELIGNAGITSGEMEAALTVLTEKSRSECGWRPAREYNTREEMLHDFKATEAP